jgi:hypothetical protein
LNAAVFVTLLGGSFNWWIEIVEGVGQKKWNVIVAEATLIGIQWVYILLMAIATWSQLAKRFG